VPEVFFFTAARVFLLIQKTRRFLETQCMSETGRYGVSILVGLPMFLQEGQYRCSVFRINFRCQRTPRGPEDECM